MEIFSFFKLEDNIEMDMEKLKIKIKIRRSRLEDKNQEVRKKIDERTQISIKVDLFEALTNLKSNYLGSDRREGVMTNQESKQQTP